MLKFRGCQSFRQRLLFSTLSGKTIRIDDIRVNDQNPGLRDFEASFLRLLEKLTNGCSVEINETGTVLRYRPGLIVCGGGFIHECGTARGIGYFIEPVIVLALFAKKNLSVTFKGITQETVDPGVDMLRTVTLPLLRRMAQIEDSSPLELAVTKRGSAPGGLGEVTLKVPFMKALPSINLTDEGMVKRIRGVATSTRVSPQVTNRMVDGARGLLNKLLADVYIFTDAVSGKGCGPSPGYGITLVAETTSGGLIGAEAAAGHGGGHDDKEMLIVPEDIGTQAASLLLEQISRGGVVDGNHQWLALTLAALGSPEVSTLRLGPLTPAAVSTLRHLKDFFGVVFDMRAEASSHTIFMTCIGAGVKNLSRKIT